MLRADMTKETSEIDLCISEKTLKLVRATTLQAWAWLILVRIRDDERLSADYCCWETRVEGSVAQKVEKI